MHVHKTEAVGARGMVSAKHPLATAAGLEMLRRGGNAVDAAVAAAFASGVAEPWMSGLGGGGYMVIHHAASGDTVVVDYGMRAPAGAAPHMYELGEGKAEDGLFPWRAVAGQANVHGGRAVAVPGTVAGLCLALERYGTLDLPAVLAPAVRCARAGLPVTWHVMARVAMDAPLLARYPETARVFFRGGFPIRTSTGPEPVLLPQPDLAATLERVAAGGPAAFYTGPVAAAIAAATHVTLADLAAYRAEVVPALAVPWRGRRIYTVPGCTGGPSLAETLLIMDGFRLEAHNSASYLHVFAEAAKLAFADRLAHMGDGRPWEPLLAPDHIARWQRRIDPERALPDPAPGELGETSTTHLCTADAAGNLVSCTQTLLSAFGSRLTAPGTGVLLNNGMFWFDPEPGGPNSPGPGKRPLSNMAPLVALDAAGRPRLALGASGGRKILNANAQVALAVLEFGLGIQAAIAAPRIDLSTGSLVADDRLPARTLAQLRARGHQVVTAAADFLPILWSSPTGILVGEDGLLHGGADPYHAAHAAGL